MVVTKQIPPLPARSAVEAQRWPTHYRSIKEACYAAQDRNAIDRADAGDVN